MQWVRNTGFVVSLAVLAFFVCSVAVQRQFERYSEPFASDQPFAALSGPLLKCSAEDFSDMGDLGFPRFAERVGADSDVVSAHQIQECEGRDLTIRTSDPPTAVPAPVDAYPVDAPSEEDLYEQTGNEAVRSVIERELSHTTSEERDIWFEELKSLPAGVVRDLLQVRKQLRALPQLLGGAPEKLAAAVPLRETRTGDIIAEPISQKIRFLSSLDSSPTAAIEAAITQHQHNLTNSKTPGYKRIRVTLVDYYRQRASIEDEEDEEESTPAARAGIQGLGCRMSPPQLDLKQGLLKNTERQLDLAISGEGFFVVKRGETEYLTRCGAFTLDSNRQLCLLVCSDSVLLQPPMTVPEDVREIQVSADGTVSILKNSEATLVIIGRLHLARVASSPRLLPAGQTLYLPTRESGPIVVEAPLSNGIGEIQQGYLEQSNVDFEAELEEIEDLQMILKSLPYPASRPVTASGTPAAPTR
ncbi:flagellar hook-basal body protein [Schlesneria sp. DSM 10557]|uniref:flagellar hook-basal body protein n=1 Tax=Schlesneria sp. DSM 10557 TaxID=3044399 RepID=UPI0035A0CD92